MADFFGRPTNERRTGLGNLADHLPPAGSDAFAENQPVPPVTPCQQGASLPPRLELLQKSMVFRFVERMCSGGRERRNREIILPGGPMSQEGHREEGAKRKTGFMGPAGEHDRQEYLNDAAGNRPRSAVK